jgi:lysophospholipase L1-like esterase
VAVGILIFGVFSVGNWTSPKWVALTLVVYAIPLLLQFFRGETIRAYALWIGIFLIVQTLITPVVVDRNYKTLPPNMVQTIDVIGDAMPGLSGIQQITTDGRGFRVTRPIDYDTKTKDIYRIVAIGGSTTEQIVLDDKRTWTHLLQERLSVRDGFGTVEVINTGISGTRALHHLSTLRHALEFEPDLVILLMGINDWNRHIWQELGAPQMHNPGVPSTAIQFSESLIGLVLKGLLGRSPAGESEGLQAEYGEYYSNQNDSLNRPTVESFRPESVAEEYRSVVEEIGEVCGTSGVSCMFVTQPSAYQEDSPDDLKKYLWMTPPNTEYTLDFPSLVGVARTYNSFLFDFAGNNGIARCDLASSIKASIDNFYDDCHFNFLGASRVADELLSCIVQSGKKSAF